MRDFTFVTDTARAFIAAALAPDSANGLTLNAGNGQGITIGALAELMLEIIGGDAQLAAEDAERVRPANSEVFELIADATLIRAQTGWEPQVPLREGLERTIEFVRERLSSFKPHLYTI